jgi:predicted nucleotidyltransferase
MGTIMKSKEEVILKIFFENPSKEWHFEEIVKEAKIARSKADGWLKKLAKEGLIKRIKIKGKMPHYISNTSSPSYLNKKRLFALNQLYESGLLNHLVSLQKARTVIVFGSFARSDWYKKSDIELFIYGDAEGLKTAAYESRLHRDIQLFVCHDKKELKRFGEGLIKNIIKGNLIKGDLDFLKVEMDCGKISN